MMTDDNFETDVQALQINFRGRLSGELANGFWLRAVPEDKVVDLVVCMKDDSWDARETVLDLLVEIHAMYVDDFTLSYTLLDAACAPAPENASLGAYATV